MDLSMITAEQLRAELESRNRPTPIFERDGKEYYTVEGAQQLIEYFDDVGKPVNLTPIEFNSNGTAKSIEPPFVVINLAAYVSNRVYQEPESKAIHVVRDTRTVREGETGNVTLQYIPEYVLSPKTKGKGYDIRQANVSREDYLKLYKDYLGVDDMLKVIDMIEQNAKPVEESTISLGL